MSLDNPEHRHTAGADESRGTYAPLPQPGQTRLCTDPWTFSQILGDGRVRPCCFSDVELGQLSEKTRFADIFNGEVAMRLRRELLTGELDTYCTICNLRPIVPVETLQRRITKLHDYAGWGFRRDWLIVRLLRRGLRFSPVFLCAKVVLPEKLWERFHRFTLDV